MKSRLSLCNLLVKSMRQKKGQYRLLKLGGTKNCGMRISDCGFKRWIEELNMKSQISNLKSQIRIFNPHSTIRILKSAIGSLATAGGTDLRFAIVRLPFLIRITLVIAFLVVAIFNQHRVAQADDREQNSAIIDEQTALIESALYTRVEFFGAQALVPYPTAEARNRLAELKTKYPDEPQLYLKLSQLDEKLGRENEASGEMRAYVELEPDKMKALETLAAFSHRRAQFEGEAEALERMIEIAPPEKRVEIFRRLIELARTHLLQKYLAPAFYQKTLAQNPSAFEIIEQYI